MALKLSLPNDLEEQLPEIIRSIATNYNIPEYVEDPDFLQPRLKAWHQFGLLTHTKKVRQAFIKDYKRLLSEYNVYNLVEEELSKQIDKESKKLLLEISLPLHDLGKIVVAKSNLITRNHEQESENLINGFLKSRLLEFNLTKQHIQYISRIVKNHGIIGSKIREYFKVKNKLTLEELSINETNYLCSEVAKEYQDIKCEIGIYFLCDSLAKTDITYTDSSRIESILSEKRLPAELKSAIIQRPINIKISEIYFKNLFK